MTKEGARSVNNTVLIVACTSAALMVLIGFLVNQVDIPEDARMKVVYILGVVWFAIFEICTLVVMFFGASDDGFQCSSEQCLVESRE